MTKFTAGPWQVWGDWAIKDCTPAENLIATFEHHDQDPEAGFANAHLMHVATDMYDLLESIAISMECEHGVDTNEINELLKKARGE